MQDEIVGPAHDYEVQDLKTLNSRLSVRQGGVLRRFGLRTGCFPANDIVPLDHRGHTDARITIFQAALYANNLPEGPHQHFCAMSHLGW
jgi:hypothetical protein